LLRRKPLLSLALVRAHDLVTDCVRILDGANARTCAASPPNRRSQVVGQAERLFEEYWESAEPFTDVLLEDVFKDAWALRTELDSPRLVNHPHVRVLR
jgi:hypothetical protein